MFLDTDPSTSQAKKPKLPGNTIPNRISKGNTKFRNKK